MPESITTSSARPGSGIRSYSSVRVSRNSAASSVGKARRHLVHHPDWRADEAGFGEMADTRHLESVDRQAEGRGQCAGRGRFRARRSTTARRQAAKPIRSARRSRRSRHPRSRIAKATPCT